MKDITRIHIAKVPYNVELSAKKNLEKYINSLEMYTADQEVLEDIEIRMTELLLERGVKQDDVISDADVAAVREQLGEPKEFMTDDSLVVVDPEVLNESAPRKLYRNSDTALLGGVMGGIASYLRVNVLWVRLVAIVLGFMSFGLLALIYIVLWLIIPPARTAAEKLQMAGRPVTLASIRELNESELGVDSEKRSRLLKRIATVTLGVAGIGLAIATAAMLAFALFGVTFHGSSSGFESLGSYKLQLALAAAAGALFIVLCLLIAFAAFAQKFNKRIWMSGIVIIVLGLGLFGAAVTTGVYQAQQEQETIRQNTIHTSIALPNSFATAKSLTVDVPSGTSVSYVVGDQASVMQRMIKGSPKATVTVENDAIKVHLSDKEQRSGFVESSITIYGPRLDSIVVSNGYVSYSSGSQANLNAEVYNSSSLRLIGSRIDTLSIKTDGSGQLSADEAAVSAVQASVYGQSSVSLGNIKSLVVVNPDVCASNQVASLTVQNIIATTYTHNGVEVATKSFGGPCLRVVFESDSHGIFEDRN